ncbi:DUF6314 family protein [Bernardetia sp.]|uniref:DUF6314 family protein n=1 Tax=Bernardetia sp. TaxID=1937974 RepID=UPI0025BBE6A0|nr:DUF6314 family protein [Bernardetia sp.]
MFLKEIFDNLVGNWSFERKIYDRKTQNLDTARGNASFVVSKAETNKLFYQEKGILLLAKSSKQINFQRKYVYFLENNAIHIFLDDGVTKGKLFQTLIPLESENSFIGTEHICRLDRHNGKYFFKDKSSFTTEYTITGKDSNIEIQSIYLKV